jgi:hypothetical protein
MTELVLEANDLRSQIVISKLLLRISSPPMAQKRQNYLTLIGRVWESQRWQNSAHQQLIREKLGSGELSIFRS